MGSIENMFKLQKSQILWIALQRLASRSVYTLNPNRNPKLPPTKLFINNEWVEAQSGEVFSATNPTTEEHFAEIHKGNKDDVDRAVKAAKDAFSLRSAWRTMHASERGKLLYKFADLVERDGAYISSLETLECGKIYYSTLKNDITTCTKYLRYFAGLADKNNGYTTTADEDYVIFTRHEPVGVCALIAPMNFPISTLCIKLPMALAAGCTVIIKPSQHSSLATLHLASLVKEAGFPPGVINVMLGDSGVGRELCKHNDVDKISLTGSTEVGKEVMKMGADTIKRLTLNLSGKSPSIILADADLDKAVQLAHNASFYNMGQCCCAATRTFVHESIYEKILEKSKALIKAKIIGDPFDLKVEHGPQVTKENMEDVLKYIETGIKEGAKLEEGGSRVDRKGYFVQPTLFTEVNDNMIISKEEIFGPVQVLRPFKDIEEVITRANESKYGLAASIIGNNIDQINTIMQNVRAGSIWINSYLVVIPDATLGGFKQSSLGREGGFNGLHAFTEVKSVFIKTPTKNS